MATATLTVWKFRDADGADRAAGTLERLAREQLLTLHDAATVSWAYDARKPKTRQLGRSAGKNALGGSFWGLLFGMIFFVPLLGAAVGAATGALSGSLSDVGIDDGFINRIRDHVTPGTSALFLMSSDAVMDKVSDAFAGHDPADLIYTNLSEEHEIALRQVFAEE